MKKRNMRSRTNPHTSQRNRTIEKKHNSGETKRPAAVAMLALCWLRKRKELGATGLGPCAHAGMVEAGDQAGCWRQRSNSSYRATAATVLTGAEEEESCRGGDGRIRQRRGRGRNGGELQQG